MTAQSLQERISGTVVHRADPDYERARCAPGWNEIKPERYPDLIVQVASEDDVIAAVNCRSSGANRRHYQAGAPDCPPKGYTAIASRTFRRGKEILYWHQRLGLGQPYTVRHKTAEQGLYGVFASNNKLDAYSTESENG